MRYLLILFTCISFGQFNPIFWAQKTDANTFIGGVSGTITTGAQLATKLGISSARVTNFKIVGSNIQAKITGGTYVLPGSVFLSDTSITYYNDPTGLVTSLTTATFRSCTNLTSVYFPNCTTIDNVGSLSFYQTFALTSVYLPLVTTINTQTFNQSALSTLNLPELTNVKGVNAFGAMNNITLINMPKCTILGSDTGNNNTFLNIKTGCVINVNTVLQTANAGAPDGDLVYATGTRSATVNYIP